MYGGRLASLQELEPGSLVNPKARFVNLEARFVNLEASFVNLEASPHGSTRARAGRRYRDVCDTVTRRPAL